jgi:hypothetical protein
MKSLEHRLRQLERKAISIIRKNEFSITRRIIDNTRLNHEGVRELHICKEITRDGKGNITRNNDVDYWITA